MKIQLKLICCFIQIFLLTTICSADNKKIERFSNSKRILAKIHNKNPLTFYCKCKYKKKKPDFKSCNYIPIRNSKRANRVEWEHIVPVSRFGKEFYEWKNGDFRCKKNNKSFKGRKCMQKISLNFRYIQSDLYNLQPVIGEINQIRSNLEMSLINGEKRKFGSCNFEYSKKYIEPSDAIQGDIARTYFYMSKTYPKYIKLTKREIKLFKNWNFADPVDEWECKRAKLIEKIQGNTNYVLEKLCTKKLN